MAFNINVLPKFDRLTALYRHRKSIEMSSSFSEETTDAHRMVHQMSMSLTTKGLLNPTGENNCFLNSAVQVLWHIAVFRRSFREVKGHHCVGKSCIFCSLKSLFSEFQHDTGQSAIPPDELRQALALCYEGQRRFQLGLMDDAAECFEKLLEQVHYHLTGSEDMDTCSAEHCISHQKFANTILERTECRCGATSEPLSFVQFVHYVSSLAFSKEAEKLKSLPPSSPEVKSFSKIVNNASAFGETRQCTNFAKCRQNVVTKRILLNSPDAFSLGLIWDSASPSIDDIMSVVSNIGLSLQLSEVFDHVFSDAAQCNQLELAAVVAYYGRHYSTFCYHSKRSEWIYFDDAKFRTIGSEWSDVCELIRKAHYQPLLLVYTNPFGETVNLSGAPTETILSSESSNTLPTVEETEEETPEEIELMKQIESEAIPSATATTATGQSSHTIDPMTLSIIPSGLSSRGHTQTNGVPSSSNDLMMFSLSPGANKSHPLAEATDKNTCVSTTTQPLTSTPTQPPTLQAHRVTPSQPPTSQPHKVTSTQPSMSQPHKVTSTQPPTSQPHRVTSSQPPISQTHGVTSTQPSMSQPHKVTSTQPPTSQPHRVTSTQPPTSQPHKVTSTQPPTTQPPTSQPQDSAVRARPHTSHNAPPDNQPKLRINNKSDVVIEETKVHAQHHTYQEDDLMSFSISPAAVMATRNTHTSSPPSNSSRNDNDTRSKGQDLIKFSLTSEDLAKLHTKQWNTAPTSRMKPRGPHVTSYEFAGKSHDSRREQSTKLDQRETKFGPMPNLIPTASHDNNRSGMASDIDQWEVLTMKRLERGSEANTTVRPPGSKSETPAVKSLKRMASLTDHPTDGIPPTMPGKPPSPSGHRLPPSGSGKPDFSNRDLPQIPIAIPQPKPSVSPASQTTGTYVELDFQMPAQSQKPITSDTHRATGQADYAEISFSKKDVPKKDSTSRTPTHSDTPIGSHPLYALPDKGKHQINPSRHHSTLPTSRVIREPTPPSGHVTMPPSQATKPSGHVTTVDESLSKSNQLIGEDPLYAVPEQVKKRLKASDKEIDALPRWVQAKLSEARDLLAKAQAVRGSDDTVALMLLTQFKSILDKILRDPVVQSRTVLSQQIRAKREEGVRLYDQLKPKKETPSEKTRDTCGRCGQMRDLDPNLILCGPCVLRLRVSS
ncbi:mucin-2-like isoform X2 [Halichondria panicea]|uniref:mucin-2-like isoform X2 n=1 Tax=Halichondria panicea TaxID=6063 RepID=UPI00312B524E